MPVAHPFWVDVVALVVHPGAAFLLAAAAGAFLLWRARRALRACEGRPWPEAARAVHPARAALAFTALTGVVGAAVQVWMIRGPLGSPPWLLVPAMGAAAWLGAALFRAALERTLVDPSITLRRWAKGVLVRLLLLYPHVVVAAAAGVLMPRDGAGVLVVLAAALLSLVAVARGGGFALARALGLAPAARETLTALCREAAAGSALHGVHEADLPMANALALLAPRRIVFTRIAADRLDDAALAAIAHHEVAHLDEPRGMRLARLSGILVLVPLVLTRPLVAWRGLTGFVLSVVAALLFAMLLRRRFRALEQRADAHAKDRESDPGTYARALEALYRINATPVVLRGSTHPSLYDRLTACGAPPDYPRPKPPSGMRQRLLFLPAIGALVVMVAWPLVAGAAARRAGAPWLSIAFDGGTASAAGELARRAHAAGDPAGAAALYFSAGDMDGSPYWPACEAIAHVDAGDLEAAEDALAEAETRAEERHTDPYEDEAIAEARRRIAQAGR